MNAPFVLRKSKKDLVIGIVAGALLLGLIVFGLLNMSRGVSGKGITGKITAKHFTPQVTETQITIGQGGVQKREVDGDYRFEVYVQEENKTYTVWVDKQVYAAQKIGDLFYFLKPAREP